MDLGWGSWNAGCRDPAGGGGCLLEVAEAVGAAVSGESLGRAWERGGTCIISESSFLEQLPGGGAPSRPGKPSLREAVSTSLPVETHSGDRA